MIAFYWIAAFLTGAGVLVVELSATRALAPFFGQALFVWTNVIGLVLFGLAVGSTLGGRLADRHPRPSVIAWVLLLGAGLVSVSAFTPPWVARALLPDALPLEAAAPFLVRGSFVTTLICFVPPILVLGAVPPFLVRCATAQIDQLGTRSGLLYGASSLGSIIGTFATSHWLLPTLGTRGAILAAAGVLAASALPLFWISRRTVAGAFASVAALALLASPALPAVRVATEGAAAGTLLHARDSSYQHIEVRRRDELGAWALALDEGHDSYQSLLPDDGVFTGGYYDAFSLVAEQARQGPRLHVLILGFAAGTHARQLLHVFGALDDLHIDGVELDPDVVEVGRLYMDLPDDPRVRVVSGLDARVFVEHAEASYDLIIGDCYGQQSFVPFHLASKEFFQAARSRLRPTGRLAMNVTGYGGADPTVRRIGETMAHVFDPEGVVVVSIPRTPNFLMIGGVDESVGLPTTWSSDGLDEVLTRLHATLSGPTRSWRVRPSAATPLDDAHTALEAVQGQRLLERARRVLRGPGDETRR